jgi:hypothetical protein
MNDIDSAVEKADTDVRPARELAVRLGRRAIANAQTKEDLIEVERILTRIAEIIGDRV